MVKTDGTKHWHEMTAEEWRNLHKDFKGTRADGKRFALALLPKGTCSIRVHIVKTHTDSQVWPFSD